MSRLYLDREMCRVLLEALAYSLLQGAVVYAAATVVCQMLRRQHASWRYNVLVVALLLIAACVPVTVWRLAARQRELVTAALSSVVNAKVGTVAEISRQRRAVDAKAQALVAASVRGGGTDMWTRVAPWALLAYAGGVVLMLRALMRSVRGGRSLAAASSPLTDTKSMRALARASQAMGFAYTPAVATCAQLSVAAVVGVLQPIVLVPLSVASGMNPEQLRLVVMHELAHIRRHDQIVDLAQRIIESFLFFNPVVWALSSQIRAERESCCDELVVRAGGDRQEYAESLIRAGEIDLHASRGPKAAHQGAAMLAVTGTGAEIKERVKRLLGSGDRPRIRLTRFPSISVNFALVAALVTPVLLTVRVLPANLIVPDAEKWITELPSQDRLTTEAPPLRVLNEWSLLHRAAVYGGIEEVRVLLKNNADPEIRVSHGWSPLHFAVCMGRPDVAELLLRAGAKVDGPNDAGVTPLHVAAGGPVPIPQTNPVAREQMLRFLISEGADTDLADAKRNRAIHFAASSPSKYALRELIAAQADVNLPGARGMTALHIACLGRDEQAITALLAAGAKCDVVDAEGLSALDHLAFTTEPWTSPPASLPHPLAVRLQQQGAKLDLASASALGFRAYIEAELDKDPLLVNAPLKPTRNGYSMLHWAALAGNADMVQVLMTRGANVNASSQQQRTPLHAALALIGANPDVLRALVNRNADVNAADVSGRRPLHLATMLSDSDSATLLLSKGAVADAPDRSGGRAFDYLVAPPPTPPRSPIDEVEIAKALASHGANVNQPGPTGKTPLHAAILGGRLDLVTYLLSAGADPNLPDVAGRTPLMLSGMAPALQKEIAQALLDKGADPKRTAAQSGAP